ncbi:hypothetical protein A1D06_11185 [Acinetobacter baumannii]|uniref:hypothetical protein n=1 Tax=Acinetobacter baumannii TaxID=470 RepID=UPI00070814A7|nr:hypothetical protein [Acinetobacter baumannii]KQD95659.1 hypothetical protein APD31_06030 [Acinetobacter baumannii]KQD98880.1 hypothetical protein APD32_16855 [Acinetobacter baumannii]MBF6794404.1 hypothetical protein [Acinetobacter baumannii]OFD23583.1 hypothetical protein A1D06_11185 [Acinetobacter baumannii]
MKPEQFIREYGAEKAREVVDGAPVQAFGYDFIDDDYFDGADIQDGYSIDQCEGCVCVPDLERLVDSLDRYSKFEDKQEALDAIDEAPEGATHYRKLSCGTRYIKQGPRFFEYWNGSEWCRPTVPFTDETHILRFDKLDDLKQSIKDHESIYGGGDE